MIAEDFVTPTFVKTEDGATEDYARFVVEPFERGYGTTVGNALRRVLLASLEGSAVTAVRIEGVQHEFSAIDGVKEDVADIVLRFKQCQLHLERNEPLIFDFKHKGEGEVTAGDVFGKAPVKVFNPDLVLFTCTTGSAKVEMDIKVAHGRGYVTAENFELEHAPMGTIYLDAMFSPVTKVNFQIEDARVGQQTDYDRLILDIWTKGSVTPEMALAEASQLLIGHLKIFVQQDAVDETVAVAASPEEEELRRTLQRSIDELELSVRSSNCLKAARIQTIGDLVSYQESEVMKFHNFGKRSLDEIKLLLEGMGLSLGMDVGHLVAPPLPPDPDAINSDADPDADADDEIEDEDA